MKTEGKNGRVQHGAAALIDPPQPTDQLAVRQGQLIDGIHLPDGVDGGGAVVVGGAAAWWGRSQASGGQPTAEGLDTGARDAGVLLAQEDPDKARAPLRVLLAQGQGLGVQGVLVSLGSWATGVSRRQRPAGLACVGEESADGAWGQTEAAGQGGGTEAGSGGGDEGVADGQGDSSRHGSDLRDRGRDTP